MKWLFYALLCFFVSACSGSEVKDLSCGPKLIEIDDATLKIHSTLIDRNVAKEVLDLASKKFFGRVSLACVRGGEAVATVRLLPVTKGKEVIVEGPCFSACAVLAFNSWRVSFASSRHPQVPSMLFLHGVYQASEQKKLEDLENLRVTDVFLDKRASLTLARDVSRRLHFIDKAEIDAAMTFESSRQEGLVIQPSSTKDRALDFLVCQPWPNNCRLLHTRGDTWF